jgi:origin recognition complex subunit 5
VRQPKLPSPPLLVVHGLEATGKSSIVKGVLSANQVPYCLVNSRECITGRHLLERIVVGCLDALDEHNEVKINRKPYARTENICALIVNLQQMMENRGEFVLVLDGIDKQREAPPTLLPALARVNEMVCSFFPTCNFFLLMSRC